MRKTVKKTIGPDLVQPCGPGRRLVIDTVRAGVTSGAISISVEEEYLGGWVGAGAGSLIVQEDELYDLIWLVKKWRER